MKDVVLKKIQMRNGVKSKAKENKVIGSINIREGEGHLDQEGMEHPNLENPATE